MATGSNSLRTESHGGFDGWVVVEGPQTRHVSKDRFSSSEVTPSKADNKNPETLAAHAAKTRLNFDNASDPVVHTRGCHLRSFQAGTSLVSERIHQALPQDLGYSLDYIGNGEKGITLVYGVNGSGPLDCSTLQKSLTGFCHIKPVPSEKLGLYQQTLEVEITDPDVVALLVPLLSLSREGTDVRS